MDGLCQLSGKDLWEKTGGREMGREMHGDSLAGWGHSESWVTPFIFQPDPGS